ncbi:hypothetical protein HMPREF9081_1434 [Centipeda periodontii DSM 2778]|uniref:Uncharacterized protein n=1 Tax=Centipeda periodontii DSM 2778 TaxID=888060 RepID=F5RME8_9FIRM|nr:hypothetical protein HMPREF9081_1434 [Centipeda periodontii DSM 2778]
MNGSDHFSCGFRVAVRSFFFTAMMSETALSHVATMEDFLRSLYFRVDEF